MKQSKKERLRLYFKSKRREVERLQEELESSSYAYEEDLGRAEHRIRACRNEAAERERQAESDRIYREDQLRQATKELERARSYGDEWGEERALRKLKNIY